MRRVSLIARYLTRRQIAERAHVAAGRDGADAIGGGGVSIGVRRAAGNAGQSAADPVVGIALGAIAARRGRQAIEVVVRDRLRPGRYLAVGDRRDIA